MGGSLEGAASLAGGEFRPLGDRGNPY